MGHLSPQLPFKTIVKSLFGVAAECWATSVCFHSKCRILVRFGQVDLLVVIQFRDFVGVN